MRDFNDVQNKSDVYVCTSKIRDKNGNIKAYVIEWRKSCAVVDSAVIEAADLKQRMLNNLIKVENLKLTTDNRIIDAGKGDESNGVQNGNGSVNDNKNMDERHLISDYARSLGNSGKAKLGYVRNKLGRVKKSVSKELMIRALAIGMGALALPGVCKVTSEVQAMNHNRTLEKIEAMTGEECTVIDTEGLINSVDKLSIRTYMDYTICDILIGNGINVGSVSRDLVAYDYTQGIKIKNDDGEVLRDCNRTGIVDSEIKDGAGNIVYTVVRTDFIGKPSYDIKDADGNTVAKLQEKWTIKGKFRDAVIVDMDDNVIATWSRVLLQSFNIEFNGSDKMSNTDAMTILTKFLMSKAYADDGSSTNSSSSSK